MDETLGRVEGSVPDTVSVGNTTVRVNKKAVNDMMETERRFWREDARKVEDALEKAFGTPLKRTEIRIAGSMASVLQTGSEMMAESQYWFPDQKCKVPSFVDCLWGLPEQDR